MEARSSIARVLAIALGCVLLLELGAPFAVSAQPRDRSVRAKQEHDDFHKRPEPMRRQRQELRDEFGALPERERRLLREQMRHATPAERRRFRELAAA